MDLRYARNIGTFTEAEMEALLSKKIGIVGCGGLGGYLIEIMARLGVSEMIVADKDVFDESNLNRQLLSDEKSLGLPKAEKAKNRVAEINSNIKVNHYVGEVNLKNGLEIFKGVDLILDGVDSIKARFVLQELAEKLDVPMIHGAIAGWYGQVTTVFPGDRTLDLIYPSDVPDVKGIETGLGNPSFTPALVASIQCSEAAKVLAGKGELLRKELLYIDTLNQEFEKIQLRP
ncbi:HesA/MoeB/ThiF family protein [Alkalibacter mobilis]|uniref:HesA/MoeB/ThiF family protein n=1 Tax=Alkalibacter mobilis TaxID=2787712 RepID=UPI0018A0544F|nr:HesA/MoeB/ThiF family protein [Alkalibacter mobilis]MBF7096963.1 HesA/MoeB/ThiF family protein [Alkalibacter mobilis]